METESLRKSLRFYFITDPDAPDLPVVEQVSIALAAGATFVQYRHKNFVAADYSQVEEIGQLCRQAGVPFVVNDHVLVAKEVGADGVHLGQEDLPPALVRRILGPEALIGLSVHTPEELEASDTSACNYLGTGPAFATGTKSDAYPVCGPEGIRAVVERTTLPVVAIGGIKAANVGACLEAGAAGVAVISAVTRAPDPLKAARRLARACGVV